MVNHDHQRLNQIMLSLRQAISFVCALNNFEQLWTTLNYASLWMSVDICGFGFGHVGLHFLFFPSQVQYECVAEQKCHNQMLQIMRTLCKRDSIRIYIYNII